VNRTVINEDINKGSIIENSRVRGKFSNHKNFPTSTVQKHSKLDYLSLNEMHRLLLKKKKLMA
jgi:hypothetical protein